MYTGWMDTVHPPRIVRILHTMVLLPACDTEIVLVLEDTERDHHEVNEIPHAKSTHCEEHCDSSADLIHIETVCSCPSEEEAKQ
jgi:hypothetical protein